MSQNIHQVFTNNPITSNLGTDLMYFGQSPYGAGNDAAMTFTNFSAQFGAPYTASALTVTSDTNVTLTLGGTPTTALLHAASVTAGWSGQLSLTRGGTNASLTANNGGIFYSTASAAAILAGTATAGLALLSGASTTPTWSTNPPITKIVTQIFTSGGTYTPTAGMQFAFVEECGGGGGSGGAASTTSQGAGSGGGQAGGYNNAWFTAATIGASQTITIGVAGSAGTSSTAGGNGGQTSFGALLTASGGHGSTNGGSSATLVASAGGSGGGSTSTGTGIFAINGQVGSASLAGVLVGTAFAIPGNGGSNPLGEGALGITVVGNGPQVGSVGTGYGAGASGSMVGGTSGTVAGAAGTAGVVIIREFCSV